MTNLSANRRGPRALPGRKLVATLTATLLVGIGLATPAVALTTATEPVEPQPTTASEPVSTPNADPASAAEPDSDGAAPEATPVAEDPQPESAEPEEGSPDSEPVGEAAAASTTGVAPAAGSVGTATGLALSVLRDGTPNNDGTWDADDSAGNDSSETNGIVRTHDSVVYRWGWSVATAGDITLVQTLPEGMSWVVSESVIACAEKEAAVSTDGRTLTCTRENQPTGASTYQVRAMVDYGANGQEMSTVLTSAGAADSAPASVTVSAAPRTNMETTIGVPGFFQQNGVDGLRANLFVNLYQPIDSNRGIRGIEGLSNEFSFTVDASSMGDRYEIGNFCGAALGNLNLGTKINGTTYTAVNSVPDAGTWTCAQSAPGQPITVTIKNAITDARTYPTETPVGKLNASRAYVASGQITVWMPSADYPETRTLTMQTSGFDPDSLSGQSNYGTGFAPGQEPGAAVQSGVNGGSWTFTVGSSVGAGMGRVYAETGKLEWLTPIPEGATSVSGGSAPMFPGQTLRFGGYLEVKSSSSDLVTGLSVCGVWDETTMSAGPVSTRTATTTLVEYAHLDVSTDAERKAADCGAVGDGDSAWSTDPTATAGGAANAVRYVFTPVGNDSPYSAVALTRTAKVLEVGTPLPVFFQYWADGFPLARSTYNPTSATHALGARALAAAAETSVNVSWDVASSDPGVLRTVSVQPAVTARTSTAVVASGVSVEVTLPASVSAVQDSWPADQAPTSVVENANGSTTYTFPFPDVSSATPATPMSFQVAVGTRIQMPSTVTVNAVVNSTSDPRAAVYRTASADLIINSPAAFTATKTATVSYAVPGVPLTYAVMWMNGLDATAGVAKLVDVLPYDGDGRGTTGLSGLTVDAVSVRADMAVQTQYTTQASASVAAAVATDRSGDTGVSWVDLPAGLNPPATTTALRFVTGDVDPGMIGEAWITVTPGSMPQDGAVANTLSGKVELLAQPLEDVALVDLDSGAVSLSGTVYQDDDYSWTRDSGESGLSGVTVQATGYTFGADGVDDGGAGDDITVTAQDAAQATTAADGSYRIDGLAPGSWTVSVVGTAASLAGLSVGQTMTNPVPTAVAESVTDLDLGYVPAIPEPDLTDDSGRVSVGDTLVLDVLDNDSYDPSATITAVGEPTSGSVTLVGDQLHYVGTTAGTVTFTYTVTDKARQSATATVTVTVVPLPTASDSTVTIGQEPTAIDLSDLFTGDAATISTTAAATSVSGSVVTYTPADGFSGQDTFTYTVTDSMGKTATATITVVVLRAPELADDTASTTNIAPVTIAVTDNDPFVGTGTLAVAGDPTHGTAEVSGTGIVYTPQAGFTGTDTFTYTVTDSVGQSDTATVTVIVVDVIALTADSARTGEETAVTVDVLDNDVATGGVITAVTQGANGAVVMTGGQVVYTPAAGFAGTDTFTYTVTDLSGATATANVTITVIARPTGQGAALRTGLDTAVSVDLGALATGDGLTLAVTTQGADGTATVDEGVLTYTPDAGFVGNDQVVLTWTDSVGQTVEVTVTIEVVDA
ncbi:tandem-95 repeat protein, partial [Cellulomonas sp. NPDC089187]|uniref:Ig-like domain-containing protein n=1 Tax=Cellulomonas sp. NPDC089187 TaxID=3154970 RepID=UPI003425B800